MKTAISFGEILWDHFNDIKIPGGAPLNVALHLQRQGLAATLVSALGDDDDGRELLAYLDQQHLDTRFTAILPGFDTGKVQVTLDAQGQASYSIVQPVAWDAIPYPEQLQEVKANALVFGSLASRSGTSYATLLRLLELPLLHVFDMNLRPPFFTAELLDQLLHRTHLLKINEHELAYLADQYNLSTNHIPAQLQELQQRFNLQTVCVTLGGDGAQILHHDQLYTHPGFSIEVADTVGAGDAFLAALITGWLNDRPMDHTLEMACATGAFVASRQGANPVYTRDDIVRFLASASLRQ